MGTGPGVEGLFGLRTWRSFITFYAFASLPAIVSDVACTPSDDDVMSIEIGSLSAVLTFFCPPHVSSIDKKIISTTPIKKDFLSALVRNSAAQPLRPPLPDIVRRVLSRCRFAYLSTVDVDTSSSHLSLMRFTYLPEEETIIMSTNTRTKKYDMLERQGGVALLVHDFSEASCDSGAGGGGVADGGGGSSMTLTGEYSITLNGTCSVVKDVVLAENYREVHLRNNPDYPQFIVGKDIAMLRVDVVTARICNISDEVIKWNVVETGSTGASPLLRSSNRMESFQT
ncbi:hypothetical protein ACHAW5_001671 [Stephanodiscus triporus]|uniref:Pyridoxamine 5'-phosphate oxidase N-terminal domain-containing protein n=1 Tax=Stephanodiscus triporus TaxID=2934178 RepID=A0ABD3NEF3_9STRA